MSDGDKMSLDDYDILSFLGEGGFARVYKAKSKKTRQEVAIKMIEKETTKVRRMVARVRKEVEIHSRLKHPSILEIYDYDEDNKYVYLVLELCHNGEFLHYLDSQGGVLTEAEARKVIRQVVEGMQYLQRHHIMHRDLKLSNLLLTQDMNIKIADFGLATRLTEPEEKHFTMCGTPNYMAPEVANKEAHGPEVDVWSLGCVLYTMLVGRNPFDTDTIRGTLDRVIQAEYDLPSDLSLEASDLIQHLLRKNPNERLQLKDVLCHPFMRGKSVATQDIIQMSEMSVDSGCGTFATTMGSSHSSSNGHDHPTTAFLSKTLGSRISEDDEANSGGGDPNQLSESGYPLSDQQYLSPIRERDGIYDLWEPMTSSQHKSNRDVVRNSPALSTNSKKSIASEAAMGPTQFDPHRYQEPQDTPSSFSWSFSASSVDSHSSIPAGGSPQIPRSTINGQEDFSLQSTKKTLDFDGCSLHQGSIHNLLALESGAVVPATHELLSKVQAYLGQCYSSLTHIREKTHGSALLGFPPDDIEFVTPMQTNQVKLTDQHVDPSLYTGSTKNISISHSSSDEEKAAASGEDTADKPTEPLNTRRLRSIRQKTKNAVVNIMDNGDVCLEFVKNKGKEQRVVEVFSVSSDGQQVTVFHPGDKGKGVAVSDCPPSPLSACKTFTFQSLPAKYFKKYKYAVRFVGLVRSKTPKVTVYTETAKCMLMENSQPADFEAAFYEGTKVLVSQRGICIEKAGTSFFLNSVKSSLHLNQDVQGLLDHVEKCRQQCMQLEAVISAVQSNDLLKDQLFPVIVGSQMRTTVEKAARKARSQKRGTLYMTTRHSLRDNHLLKIVSAKSPATMESIPSFSDALACTEMETDSNKLLHRCDTLSTTLLSSPQQAHLL